MVAISAEHGKITFLEGQPTRLAVDPSGPVFRDLDRRMTKVQYGARARVRKRTGTLFSTIRKQPHFGARSLWIDVVAGGREAPYVMIEHDGSRPHEIRARHRKTLRFTVGGVVVFRTRVWHPGTSGTHFLTLSLDLAAD